MLENEGLFERNGRLLPMHALRMHRPKNPYPHQVHRLHYHAYLEILYGKRGTAAGSIAGVEATLTPGKVLLVFADEVHRFTGIEENTEYLVLKILPECLFEGGVPPELTGSVFCGRELEDDGRIGELMEHICTEWEAETYGYENEIRADALRILNIFLRKWNAEGKGTVNAPGGVARILHGAFEYAAANFATVDTRSAAEHASLSYSYFSRIFKAYVGQSFTSYVTALRLQEAMKLLVSTDYSVGRVAEECGFGSESRFIALFGKYVGTTPHRFRRGKLKPSGA